MKKGSPELRDAGWEFRKYCEARAIAAHIAERDNHDPDIVFSDAMHVAVALALEDSGTPYTKTNVARMFERVSPGEVHAILLYRHEHGDEYRALPMAGIVEKLNAAQIATANAVAKNLTPAQLDAFFFGEVSGSA